MLKKYVSVCTVPEAAPPAEIPESISETVSHSSSAVQNIVVTSAPEMTVIKQTVSAEKSAVADFFNAAGIEILEKNVPDTGDIIYLVNAIADSLPLSEEFLHTLRKASCCRSTG